eukprot:TRINITY_DN26045_c0_g1_i4.p1 TRINITY_DN26045_c0_g1~~TRINITY_DN26045_c0_g1_i4.p1  ORF type:complete len:212 (+),score=36.48 TRINITY_DN26045_c0_g1_i4:287-922(+)
MLLLNLPIQLFLIVLKPSIILENVKMGLQLCWPSLSLVQIWQKSDKLSLVLQNELFEKYKKYSQDPLMLNEAVGMLQAIVEILKTGERSELLENAIKLIPIISSEFECKSNGINTILRKFKVKLAERVGLVLLKPKVATWRYQRGYRSLLENLINKAEGPKPVVVEEVSKEEEDEEVEREKKKKKKKKKKQKYTTHKRVRQPYNCIYIVPS